jgi:hypothetical protein
MMIDTSAIVGNISANYKALASHIENQKAVPAPKATSSASSIGSDYVAKGTSVNFLSYDTKGKL